MGKLIDVESIDYVRLEDSLHCLEHHKGDEVECVICAPTVEAIPKADYEKRLKADMVAMLTEIQLEIEEKHREEEFMNDWNNGYNSCLVDGYNFIQQKIDSLKGE